MSYIGKYRSTNPNETMFKKHEQDAGLDIVSSEEILIPPRSSAVVSTGLYLEIPPGHVGLLWPRSGLSVKNKIEIGAGCIDASYRGEVKVHLYNHGSYDYQIRPGDRIAQLLTVPVNLHPYEKVNEISETDRGDGGFGSTGV